MAVKKTVPKTETTYTKEQIVKSKKFACRCDLLNVILEDGKSYTLDYVTEEIKKFDEGGTK